MFLDFSTVFIPLLSISRSPIPAQRFTRKQIRLYSGEHELPDGTTLQELHIEHLSRIIMRNDGEEVVRDGEQSKDGEEVVCDEAVGNPHHLFTDNNFLQVNICLRQQFSSF